MGSSVLLGDALATLRREVAAGPPPFHPSLLPCNVSYYKNMHPNTYICVTHRSPPPPPSPVPGIHASGERLPLSAVHHGHWHEALSASDPLSLITDKQAVQKAQKSSVMSGVTYIQSCRDLQLPPEGAHSPQSIRDFSISQYYLYLIVFSMHRRTY